MVRYVVTGKIRILRRKEETATGKCGVIRITGMDKPYFFWSDRIVDQAGVEEGDWVRLTLTGNKILQVEKIEDGEKHEVVKDKQDQKPKQDQRSKQDQREEARFRDADQIIRTEAAKIACEIITKCNIVPEAILTTFWELSQQIAEYIRSGTVPEYKSGTEKNDVLKENGDSGEEKS